MNHLSVQLVSVVDNETDVVASYVVSEVSGSDSEFGYLCIEQIFQNVRF